MSTETGYNQRAEDGTYWRIVDADFKDGPWDSFNSDKFHIKSIKKYDRGELLSVEDSYDTEGNSN